MPQLVQIAGALAILAGFALAQLDLLAQRSRLYLGLNLAGSALLAALAYLDRQWGFLLLEDVWALFSGAGLIATRLRDAAEPAPRRR
jgi:hypothetical protein